MIDLYTWSTPNGFKISIMLEELDVPYQVKPIDIGKGGQHSPEFRRISPNGKIPAIIDHDPEASSEAPRQVFESGNILIYLAEKYHKFLSPSGPVRSEQLGWLFFQMAHLGPMVGQWHWFKHFAESKNEMALTRYQDESLRLVEVMNARLDRVPYMGGDQYSIADIACYPWAITAVEELSKVEASKIKATRSIHEWLARVGDRPAVARGMGIPTDEQKQQTV